MKILHIFAISVAVSMLFGCETTRRTERRTSPATSSTVTNTLSQHDSQIAKLSFSFNQLKESNRSCVTYINKLNKQVALLNRKIATLEQSNKQLTLQLANEKKSRQQEIDRLLKEVAKETAAAINTRRTPPPPPRRSSTGTSGPAIKGEFYEYKVEPGATLSVIAKAYKVSVSDIKRANRLKSDIIHVGQKLYIPKR